MMDPTPAQMADFDQKHAETSQLLDDLIASYRSIRATDLTPRELDMCGMASWMLQNSEHAALAEVLSVAIDRLAGIDTEEKT